ncbi:Sec-independent protein translocase protein TatA / Sec-independent protein translocase protein TatB [Candidatus Desulfarcum epimagneticum]|uniref:Sec-independent protein translocase protein TatA n=1 Tax=uncultured Desulfobacteraceae bacterium TaxID=218296 RepID=A0A484HJ90_9BACT|nr:Sec-independent protein translocase protein TatA / Sec-independent protein translocase protein TatB [uncultured Desulfobacteraceae bacterium]
MFGIGMPEMIMILVIALIVIGPKKLPDLAKSLGRAMGEFKRATSDLKASIDLEGDIKGVEDGPGFPDGSPKSPDSEPLENEDGDDAEEDSGAAGEDEAKTPPETAPRKTGGADPGSMTGNG